MEVKKIKENAIKLEEEELAIKAEKAKKAKEKRERKAARKQLKNEIPNDFDARFVRRTRALTEQIGRAHV